MGRAKKALVSAAILTVLLGLGLFIALTYGVGYLAYLAVAIIMAGMVAMGIAEDRRDKGYKGPYHGRMVVGSAVSLLGVVVAGIAGSGHALHLWGEHAMFIAGGIGLGIVALGMLFATGSGNLPP